MKKKIEKNENEKSLQVKREKFWTKFSKNIKKRWLVSRLNTLILMLIVIGITIAINVAVKSADFTAIDCTTSKDYSLTEETKSRIADIDKEILIYVFNFKENDNQFDLVKQYEKVNSKIKVELIDTEKNVEITKKFNIIDEMPEIVVEIGDKNRTLTYGELLSYDSTTGRQSWITEQKVTSAIINLTSEKQPKAYLLTGYTDANLASKLNTFKSYIENENLEFKELNILSSKNVPEDCDTLIIMTPVKDFDDLVADEIIKYIKKGGNILWFNGIYEEDKEFKNVNRVLSEYGVKPFEKGVIYETDKSKIFGYDTCFAPDILESSTILKNVKQSAGTVFFSSTKIDVEDTEKLEELKVEKKDLLQASDKSYFTKDLTGMLNTKDDKEGPFVVGAEITKTVEDAVEASEENEAKEAIKSTLIIYGNDLFISDFTIQIAQGYSQTVFSLFNNADVALNSLAYLTDNYQDITIRKNYSDSQTTFLPTEMQKAIIMVIIFAVPVIIIIIGLIIWIRRKRRQ